MSKRATIISEDARLAKGTVVEVLKYFEWCDEYYVKSTDSNLAYPVKAEYLKLHKEDSDDNS